MPPFFLKLKCSRQNTGGRGKAVEPFVINVKKMHHSVPQLLIYQLWLCTGMLVHEEILPCAALYK